MKAPVYASLRSAHPVFGYVPFTHPEIVRKPVIMQVSHENRTVSFSDKSKLEDVDHIIFATGYSFSLPFLPSVEVVNRRVPGLYLHIFRREDPTLALIGGVSNCSRIKTRYITHRITDCRRIHIPRLRVASSSYFPILCWKSILTIHRLAKAMGARSISHCGRWSPFLQASSKIRGVFRSAQESRGRAWSWNTWTCPAKVESRVANRLLDHTCPTYAVVERRCCCG